MHLSLCISPYKYFFIGSLRGVVCGWVLGGNAVNFAGFSMGHYCGSGVGMLQFIDVFYTSFW